jgi:hypothetical protein
MRLARFLKPARRKLRRRAADPCASLAPARRKRGARAPGNPQPMVGQVRIAEGELGFNAWIAHLTETGQTFAARYWREQGYVLAAAPYPPVADRRR